MRIFLSYRRDDTSGHAGRLYDALSRRLGEGNVFQDVAAIDPGVDFGDAIVRALDDCDAVLAVIGPAWVMARTPAGVRRLEQPDDYVRLELSTALARDARVIPVLVGGAEMPSSADLPEELRSLVDRQAVVLHDQSWQQDVDGLVARLRGQPTGAATTSDVGDLRCRRAGVDRHRRDGMAACARRRQRRERCERPHLPFVGADGSAAGEPARRRGRPPLRRGRAPPLRRGGGQLSPDWRPTPGSSS